MMDFGFLGSPGFILFRICYQEDLLSLISYLEKLGLWRSELGAKNCTIDRTTKGYIKGRESGISFL